MKCPHCGAENKAGASSCWQCYGNLVQTAGAPESLRRQPQGAPGAVPAKGRPRALIIGLATGVVAIVATVVLVLPRAGITVPFISNSNSGGQSYADGKVQTTDKTELATLFRDASGTVKSNPDSALSKINQALQKDAKNANLYYLKASAHAYKQQWTEMSDSLAQGNRQRESYLYVVGGGRAVLEMSLAHYSHVRQVARSAAAGQAGEQGLLGAREMGRKIMEEQPLRVISCLVGVAIVAIADDGLVKFYQKQNKTEQATEWAQRMAADRRWGDTVKDAARTMMRKASEQAKTSGVDLQNLNSGTEKVNALAEEIMKLERQTVQEVLASRPA